jgi:hypothetical protein
MPDRWAGTTSSSRLAAVFAKTARTSPYDGFGRSSRGVKCIHLCKILRRPVPQPRSVRRYYPRVSEETDRQPDRTSPLDIQDPGQVLAEWAAGRVGPPGDASPDAVRAWRDAQWHLLTEAISGRPDAWWIALLELVRTTTISQEGVRRLADIPLRVLLSVGGETYQRFAVDAARDHATMAALAFEALERDLGTPGEIWSGAAAVVELLGVDTAVAAWVRLYAGLADSGWSEAGWKTVDFWAFMLGGHLGASAPALGWDFVRGIVAAVPDTLLEHVGSSELEDFCWAAADAYIDRIEAESVRDPRFQRALRAVWPGGATISPAIYLRIRQAAAAET